jgi:ribosomal protein S18
MNVLSQFLSEQNKVKKSEMEQARVSMQPEISKASGDLTVLN